MVPAGARAKRIASIVRIGLGVAVLSYGIYLAEPASPRLMIFGLTLFALPLLFQFLPWPLARAYALWFGAFLVIQSLVTPILPGDTAYLVGHVPNRTNTITFAEGVLPGITGPQRITTDERGFRVTPPIDYANKRGVRIFAIGGSTTEEMSLDDEVTWTHRLQLALSRDLGKPVEVINTGVSGLRLRHHIATLKHVLPMQPDIVLFLVGVNDWNFDTYVQFGSNLVVGRMTFRDTILGQTASVQYNRIFRARPRERDFARTVTFDEYNRRSLEREEKISWFPESVSDQYRANLLRISEICRDNALTCVFLTQPSAYVQEATHAFRDRFWMTPPRASYTLTFDSLVHIAQLYNRALLDFAKQSGHPACDLAPHIAPTETYFTDEIHFTAAGAARVAELVTACVRPLVPGFLPN